MRVKGLVSKHFKVSENETLNMCCGSVQVIQIRKKLLKGEVKSQFEEISERLEKASETLTLSAMCLDSLKVQYNEEVGLRQVYFFFASMNFD